MNTDNTRGTILSTVLDIMEEFTQLSVSGLHMD